MDVLEFNLNLYIELIAVFFEFGAFFCVVKFMIGEKLNRKDLAIIAAVAILVAIKVKIVWPLTGFSGWITNPVDIVIALLIVKCITRRSWINSMIMYLIGIIALLPAGILSYFGASLLTTETVVVAPFTSVAAVAIYNKIPVHKLYGFFEKREKVSKTIVFIAILGIVLGTTVAVYIVNNILHQRDTDLIFASVLAAISVGASIVVYRFLNHLDTIRKVEEATNDQKAIVSEILDEKNSEKMSALRIFMSRLKKK